MTTIVLGIDGANWEMIRPWLEDGELPNLQQLIESGVGGTSQSCLPPITVPNWKCYSTGKNPGKLDVFRFDTIDTETQELVFHDSNDFKSVELWDYLNDAGYTAGVINKPSTYPPRKIDGFIVAGGPDAADGEYRSIQGQYATPEHVQEFLESELDYSIHPSPILNPADNGTEEIEAALDLIENRFEAAEALLEREDPDFLHMTIFYNMVLQHYFWTDDPVLQAWKKIDTHLEQFMDEGHNIILMSDHGTDYVESVFYINVWLEENDYVTYAENIDEHLRKLGITRERALAYAKKLNVVELLARVVPESLQKIVPWEEGVKRDRVIEAVDWNETNAVASGQGPIYLTAEPGTEEYEETRRRLIAELPNVRHPETGKQFVTAVHRGEEYYDGPYADNAPDLVLEQNSEVHVSDAIGRDEWYGEEGVWKGGNMPEGIFLANGPSFREDGLTERANIVDLAPTILHSMGVDIPTDMDGEVLNIFATGTDPEERPVQSRDPIDKSDNQEETAERGVEERLESLGYLE